MRKTIRSQNALRAFESAARHGSFARTTEELAVSPSAISQHVSALEEGLGITLFDRGWPDVLRTKMPEDLGNGPGFGGQDPQAIS